jgi:hypothetical protein
VAAETALLKVLARPPERQDAADRIGLVLMIIVARGWREAPENETFHLAFPGLRCLTSGDRAWARTAERDDECGS